MTTSKALADILKEAGVPSSRWGDVEELMRQESRTGTLDWQSRGELVKMAKRHFLGVDRSRRFHRTRRPGPVLDAAGEMIIDPGAFFEVMAEKLEEWADGPEDDVRIVKAARASAKALKAEAARWRRL